MKTLLTAAILFASSLAFAQTPPPAGKGHHPCHADAKRLCGDVKKGGGRIKACLKAHEAELSPECKAKAEEFKD